MRIMHMGEFVSGGVATYLKTLLTHQIKADEITDISVFLSDKNSEDFSEFKNINVTRYQYDRKSIQILKNILYLRRQIKYQKPDVIHIHSSFAGLMGRLALVGILRDRPKVIYCSHGWSFLIPELPFFKKIAYTLIERALSLQTDCILNISKHEYKKSIENGLSPNKSYLVPSGIHHQQKEVLLSNIQMKNLFISSSSLKLAFIGRFDRSKGIDILLERISSEKLKREVELLVIGSSVLGDVELNLDSYKENKKFNFLGWVKSDEIDAYISQVDAVIIPSRWEGFGLVGLEAMRNKKPIIVSDRGALPELVDQSNGFIFNLEDELSLYKILENVEKKHLKKMGVCAFQIFEENYTSDKMNANTLKIYKTILSK